MSETLSARLRRLRSRVRQVMCLRGLCWLIAVALGAVLVVGLADWLLHLDDSGMRLILGMGILGTVGYVGWRLLLAPLRRPLTDIDLALKIERRFPGFQDSLASTVHFLAHNADPRDGSPTLQQDVIRRTLRDVEQIELDDVIETRPLHRALWTAAVVCLLTATVAGFNQAEAATAIHRLLFPFATHPWPRQTELQILTADLQPLAHDANNPLRLARGDTLALFVENRKGSPPDDLVIEYRIGTDDSPPETAPTRRTSFPASNGTRRDVGAAQITATKGPLLFRAVGGDDRDMPWQHADVVPPPTIDSLQITLTPPAYSGQLVTSLPSGVGHLQGLIGTHVEIEARTNKPLARVQLRIKDEVAQDVALAENEPGFRAAFTIRDAGVYAYWFELQDQQGFGNPNMPHYEIRGIADLPPEVSIDQPATDLQVTADAVVPLRIVAKDDLGLKDVRLRYHISTATQAAQDVLPLWSGADRPQQQIVETEWDLADLNLTAGAQVVFFAEAADHYDLDGGHVNRSITRTLTVVGADEKKAEIAERQRTLVEELEAVRDAQQAAGTQVGELLQGLSESETLRDTDLDLLKRLEIDQRQISSRLTNASDGLEARAKALQTELENNRLDDAAMTARLEQVTRELAVLREDHLPIIEQELTQARKAAQTESQAFQENNHRSDQQREALASAERNQRAVTESLEQLLDQLSEWREQRDLRTDLDDLTQRQQELNRLSTELRPATLGKSIGQLTPGELESLRSLADQQRRQADRLDKLAAQIEQARQESPSSAPQAESLQDAAEQLRRDATAGGMREAARELEQNHLGEAGQKQQDVLGELRALQETLQNRGTSVTEMLVKRMRETEEQVETLRKRQDDLRHRAEAAAANPDPQQRGEQLEQLRKEQRQLQSEAEDLARRLRRLQAPDAGEAARRAAARMEQAAENLGDDAAEQAQREQQDALDDLEQAQRELAEERQRTEEQLAREMLERIADQLKSMIARQQNVVDEIQRLEAERVANRGTWKRTHAIALRNQAEVQRGLKQETDRLVESMKAAEVFALALEVASRQMEQVAQRLTERQTDATTIRAAQNAKQQFVDLVAALQPADDGNAGQANPQGGGAAGEQPQQAAPPSDGIPHLAQLKMLRTLQESIMRRTAEFDQIRRNTGELSTEQRTELEQLALQQTRLADLARNLMRQFVEAFQTESTGEDTPQ